MTDWKDAVEIPLRLKYRVRQAPGQKSAHSDGLRPGKHKRVKANSAQKAAMAQTQPKKMMRMLPNGKTRMETIE